MLGMEPSQQRGRQTAYSLNCCSGPCNSFLYFIDTLLPLEKPTFSFPSAPFNKLSVLYSPEISSARVTNIRLGDLGGQEIRSCMSVAC